MQLNFAAALATLDPNEPFEIINEARPAADFLFNDLLPERPMGSFHVSSGSMTVRSTMAGLVAEDSPYPPGGIVTASQFLEETAKLGITVGLPEKTLRAIYELLRTERLDDSAEAERLADEALNFYDLVIVQASFDVMEWLRGQVFAYGRIDWRFNKKRLLVEYGIPAAHFLPTRTVADGTDYGGPNSMFWTDVTALRRIHRARGIRAFIAHPDTIDAIRYNRANQLAQVGGGDEEGYFDFVRYARNDAGAAQPGMFSQEQADRIRIISYGLEGEILNPNDPDTTLLLPFCPPGKLIAIARAGRSGYVVGAGSQANPPVPGALGYTHLAPTIEGGRPGRWGRLFTPENAQWSLIGEMALNGLPVLEDNRGVAVGTTELRNAA